MSGKPKIDGNASNFKTTIKHCDVNVIEKIYPYNTNADDTKVKKIEINLEPFYVEKQLCTGCNEKCKLGAFAMPEIKHNHVIVCLYPVVADKIYKSYYDNYFCKTINTKKEINLLSVRALRNGQLFKAHAWLQNCIMYESLSDAEIISWHCKMNKQRQKS